MSQLHPESAGIRNISRASDLARSADRTGVVRVELPDEALMVAITVSRDEVAFALLYDRYVDLVYSASLRVLSDSQLAEDTTQDVFVRLWNRPETFIAERGKFLSWLMSVARNRAIDELRARGRRRQREGGPLGEPAEAATPLFATACEDPPRSAEIHEEQALVRRALTCLPADQQRALELAYFRGMTQQEIALALHEPLGTVKTRIRLGMQKLRRALDQKV